MERTRFLINQIEKFISTKKDDDFEGFADFSFSNVSNNNEKGVSNFYSGKAYKKDLQILQILFKIKIQKLLQ